MDTLSRTALPLALAAQDWLCGIDTDRESAIPQALEWLKRCWEQGDDHIPYLLVHDLGHILLYGREIRFASARAMTSFSEEEREIRLRYEDRVLGQWALDPSVREAHVAVAGLAPKLQQEAISHAIRCALSAPLRELPAGACRGNPAHLREIAATAARRMLEAPADRAEWRAQIAPEWLSWALAPLPSLAALGSRRLFTEEDLWEVAHLEALPSESARLALRGAHEVVRRVGPMPVGSLAHLRQRARQVPVDQTHADTYPTGGFDAVSTRGSVENLVRSEIMYVGEGIISEGQGRAIDLFDVRYLEGELLHYTRDDSPLLDARRTLRVSIGRPASLRFKHAALHAQTLVLVEALALALHGDLVRTFGPAAARSEICWLLAQPADLSVAAEEQALLSIALGPEIAHRRASFDLLEEGQDAIKRGGIVFSPLAQPARFAGCWVRVDGEHWQYGGRSIDASSLEALRELATSLLVDSLL